VAERVGGDAEFTPGRVLSTEMKSVGTGREVFQTFRLLLGLMRNRSIAPENIPQSRFQERVAKLEPEGLGLRRDDALAVCGELGHLTHQ